MSGSPEPEPMTTWVIRLVRKVMVAEAVDIDHEYYLSILMDRDTSRPVIVASTEGGMSIEDVAHDLLRCFLKRPVGR